MKGIVKKLFLIIFLILLLLLSLLSTFGYETNRFNKIISSKVNQKEENISLNLKKIKFKIDIKNLSLFLKTDNPQIDFYDLNIPINNVNVYLDFISLIRSDLKINKIVINSNTIEIEALKKILIKTKPSNLNSFIVNNVKEGKLNLNLELYFKDNFELDNFIAKGNVKGFSTTKEANHTLKNSSFDFFTDYSDTLIKNVNGEIDGILIKEGSIQIENQENISIKSDFVTDIIINDKNFIKFSKYFKNKEIFRQKVKMSGELAHNLSVTFDKTLKVKSYSYNNKGKINDLIITPKQSFDYPVVQNIVKTIRFRDIDFNFKLEDNGKKYVSANGNYTLNSNNFQSLNLQTDFSNIKLEFSYDQLINLEFINYKKPLNKIANISLELNFQKDSLILKRIRYEENKNLISINNLKVNQKKLVSLEGIKVITYKKEKIQNDFKIDFRKKIQISGKRFDGANLGKILNKDNSGNFLNKINKDVDIDFLNVATPLNKNLKNFKLIGTIKKGKFVKISSKGDFGDDKYLEISLKSDKQNKKKYLEIYSDLPQPLLSEYSFFKGLSEGTLIFSSIIEGKLSNSKLKIENFKIINAPGLIQLLSLADFGGLADLAKGDGLSFDNMEIILNNNKNFITIEELFAIGPSISVLMEGYREPNEGIVSLRGTLIPARNLNKLLAKIPVIGNIIIPKEIGEGLFGVSFKIKGPPGKVKTTINPIKTLTPRFITKALEKSK